MSVPDPTNLICSRYPDRTGFILVWDSSVSSGMASVSYDIEEDRTGNGEYTVVKNVVDDGLADRQCTEIDASATQQYFFRVRAIEATSAPDYSDYVYVSGGL